MRFAASRPVRLALVLLAAVLPLLVLSTPASAAPTTESATAAAKPPVTAGGPHCTLTAGANQQLHCFATFRQAVAYATGGRITDAPLSATGAVKNAAFAAEVEADAAVAPAVSSVVGIEYADANFSGASLTLAAAGRCDNSADVDFRFAGLPAGWNDRITSFHSFSNCAQQLFRNTNFGGGALTLIINSLANVGAAANDQASSITFN